MPNFTDLTGLAGVASAATASLLLLPGMARPAKTALAIMLGAAFVLLLIPFSGMPLAAYLRGATGDLSITTQVLVWCALLRPWISHEVFDARSRNAVVILVALAALALYPMALGLGSFDPYRLGFGEVTFVSVLLLLALTCWIRKLQLIALCISLAILAWSIGWYESGNLWDYLLDPLVAIYALIAIPAGVVKAVLQRGRAHESQPTSRG